MGPLIRKAWVINLVFVIGAAYFGAKTVNSFVAARYAPVPDLGEDGPIPPSPGASGQKLARDLGMPVSPPTTEHALGPANELPFAEREAVRSGLPVRLVGTLVASRWYWSMASIEDLSDHSAQVFMVGDRMQGARIVRIERLRVIIDNEGRKEFIDSEPGDGGNAVAAASGIAPQRSASDVGPVVRAVGNGTFEISRAEFDRQLRQVSNFEPIDQTRIVPAFKDGVAQGLKLFSIRPDSIYSKIGIQNGDVIRRINGFEINSPDKALELYTKLRESNRIEFELDRNGTPLRQQINVR